MQRLFDGLYRALLYAGAAFMAATFLVIVLAVAGRQFGLDFPGMDAYAGFSIAASMFLALPATLRSGDHIRVTLLLSKLKGKARVVLDYWCLLTATALAAYLAYFAMHLVWVSHATHDVSPAGDATPLWIPQIAMAVGCVGLALAFAEDLVLKMLGQERPLAASEEIAHVE